jgi:hypothetical protein
LSGTPAGTPSAMLTSSPSPFPTSIPTTSLYSTDMVMFFMIAIILMMLVFFS